MNEITIGTHKIGPDHPPFIVAELSGNHQGSFETALKLIEAAHQAGAHAVKLQTYTADTLTLNIKEGEFYISNPRSPWKGKSLYELYQLAYTPWEWHQPLFERCRELGLIAFSTPFDETAVDFLETLNPPCYKIASLEIVDLPLIQKVAETGKPLILSTAGASLAEIDDAVTCARKAGCRDIILLKCTTAHPAPPSDCHLRTIPHMASCFNTCVGLSDHTLGIGVPVASVALGACLIEKHLTLSRREGGVDSAFSLEPGEFKSLVDETANAWKALGTIRYAPMDSESSSLSHRPSLYFVEDLLEGAIVEPKHIRSVRPCNGLPPKELPKILGLEIKHSVKKGTPVKWEFFKNSSYYGDET